MSTPLDRLKEAFPESKGWKVELVRGGLGWMARAGTEPVMVDSGFKQDWYHPVVVRYEAATPDAAVDACIAKAREVGINSEAEAHADRLAEALRRIGSMEAFDLPQAVNKSNSLWPELEARMDHARSALAAHDARRGKA